VNAGAARWAAGWLGAGLLAAVWLGPLPALAAERFAAHMLMHVTVVALAAPLLALALAGGRGDPVRRAPALFAALPAAALELLVVWAWHAPALHHAARHHGAALALEQGSFLLAGLLVWLAALGGGRPRPPGRAAAGILGLLLTSMHMTLLGTLLVLAPRVLYGHGGEAALRDQQLGGLLMLLAGGTAYLAGALYLLVELLRERRTFTPRRGGAAAVRSRRPTPP